MGRNIFKKSAYTFFALTFYIFTNAFYVWAEKEYRVKASAKVILREGISFSMNIDERLKDSKRDYSKLKFGLDYIINDLATLSGGIGNVRKKDKDNNLSYLTASLAKKLNGYEMKNSFTGELNLKEDEWVMNNMFRIGKPIQIGNLRLVLYGFTQPFFAERLKETRTGVGTAIPLNERLILYVGYTYRHMNGGKQDVNMPTLGLTFK